MLEFWKPPTMDDVRAGEEENKFKVISMFAGLGGSSTGYRLAGGKVLAVNEFIDYRQSIYTKNYPTTPVWPEDIRKLTGEEILRRTGLKKGELDILDGSPPCFVAGTQIYTTTGFKNIESIEAGDMVLTHKNRFRKVVAPMSKTHSGKMFKISLGAIHTSVIVTPEHPFFVLRGDAQEWVTASDLKLSDKIGRPSAIKTDLTEAIRLTNETMRMGGSYIVPWRPDVDETEDSMFWSDIHEIRAVYLRETVYNMSVEEDESYTANEMAVHNCSDFSTNNMGTREQKWGKVKNYSNTTQRVDDLFYEFARIITEVQPKVFIAENVKGLVIGSAKQILGTESSLSKFIKSEDPHALKGLTGQDATILEALKNCGYKVSYKVMKASEYGVPQIRERLIFMGVRNDLPFNPSFPKAMEKYLVDPIVGKTAIGEFLFNGANVPLNPETMTCQYIKNYFPPHCTKKMVLDIMKKNDLKTFAHRYHRDTWHKVFYTIVSQDGNNTTHSIIDRYNSVCEGQRVQAFPDDYQFDMYPSNRIKVSIADLENPHFTSKIKYKWFHAGHEAVDVKKPTIKDIIALTGWDYDKIRDDKVFSIDTEVDYDWDKKQYQHSSRVWESIGRAVPPLLHKVVADHVYANILRHVNEHETVKRDHHIGS